MDAWNTIYPLELLGPSMVENEDFVDLTTPVKPFEKTLASPTKTHMSPQVSRPAKPGEKSPDVMVFSWFFHQIWVCQPYESATFFIYSPGTNISYPTWGSSENHRLKSVDW